MKIHKLFALLTLIYAGANQIAKADEAKPLYENHFETTDLDKVPEDFLVIDGGFAVKAEDGNKFLELPGEPLDSFGIVFGPALQSNVCVTARIRGTKKGRRTPTFAVGLNGQSGYRLQVSPAKGCVEIIRDNQSVTNMPLDWKSGGWTFLKLQVIASGDAFKVQGKAWSQGAKEPEAMMLSCDAPKDLPTGRASIWGSPISGTPIQFDDLVVQGVTKEK